MLREERVPWRQGGRSMDRKGSPCKLPGQRRIAKEGREKRKTIDLPRGKRAFNKKAKRKTEQEKKRNKAGTPPETINYLYSETNTPSLATIGGGEQNEQAEV